MTIQSPFNWRGQPSEIIARNPSWHAKVTQVNRRASAGAKSGVHLKGSSPPMRDNAASAFFVAIAPPFDAGSKTCKILKGALGSQA